MQEEVFGELVAETSQSVALFEGRVSESFQCDAISDRLMLILHITVIARYDNSPATPRISGIGPGVILRH